MKKIYYKKVFHKYKLANLIELQTSILPEEEIILPFIKLRTDGMLFIKAGYAWDGASGPTFDTENTVVPSAGHDAEFQLMREGFIDRDVWFRSSNDDIYRWMRERGMNIIRARAWRTSLNLFGYKHTLPITENLIEVW